MGVPEFSIYRYVYVSNKNGIYSSVGIYTYMYITDKIKSMVSKVQQKDNDGGIVSII